MPRAQSLHGSARQSSGFDTAGSFLSQQPPVPFPPQPAFPGCSSVGLGKHCHYPPQRAALLPSDTATPLPLIPWAGMSCEQVWEVAFSWLKQLWWGGILPEKTTDWREASGLNEVRNSVLGSISLKQNREQQTRQCDSFFLDIQQWKQHVNPSKMVLRFSTWWTTHEWIFKLTLEITTSSDRASQLLYFHQ